MPDARQPIPGYELLKKLGEGGMGATYLARQATMDRLVALKVLKKNLAKNQSFIDRFHREARLAGQLNHVNIVGVHDTGEGGGFHYLAMEYVEGRSLQSMLDESGALEEGFALHLAMQVARALDMAHQAGIIHRDVKPDNVLVDEKGVAKLCDFGLARSTEAETRMTQTGMMMGTPHYVSPEQARGDKDVDIRTDIYSLGATLYHFVTGQTPFQGSSAAVVMAKHLTEELPWPADVNPDVSEPVCRLIERMMAKEREDRYESPAELIRDIELVIDGKMPDSAVLAPGRSSIGRRGQSDVKPVLPRRPGRHQEAAGTAGKLLEPVGGRRRLPVPILAAAGAVGLAVVLLVVWLAVRGGGEDPKQAAAAREAAAEKAWSGEVSPLASPADRAKAGRLLAVLGAFEGQHGGTGFARGKVPELARMKAAAEAVLAGGEKPPSAGDKSQQEMYELAAELWKKDPEDYAGAVARFEKVRKSCAGSKWELLADEAIGQVNAARSKAADAAFAPLAEKAGKLAAAGDYDGALAAFGAPPEKFADLLAPKFEAERKKLKTAAEERLNAALTAGEKLSADGQPENGLAELAKVKAVKYAVLLPKVAELEARLKKESADAAGKMAKQREAEARKLLESILVRYDELALAGQWTEAAVHLAAAKKKLDPETLRAMPPALAAAERVVGQVVSWQGGREAALAELLGREVELRTRVGGSTRGTVEEVGADAFKVKVRFKVGGTEGSSVQTVRFADLVPGELDRLLPAFKPEGDDGQMAAAILAMGQKDVAGSEKALTAAGEHPLAARWAKQLDVLKLGAVEATAKEAWEKEVLARSVPKYTAEQGKAMLAALDAYLAAHGKTEFAKGRAEDVEMLRSAARLPLGPVIYTKWPFDTAEAKRRQKETADGLGLPVEQALDLGGGVKLELVLIPAGEFVMGGSLTAEEINKRGPGGTMEWWEREQGQHRVRITKPFYFGKYEVTQEQWEKVMGSNPAAFKDSKRHPVEQVSWDDCQNFVKKLNETFQGKAEFRLPTEAEWEHACRAGTETSFWFGEKITTDRANYNGEYAWDGQKGVRRGKTVAVGSFQPNPWGLYDVVGNVWEWCQDWYDKYGKEAQADPKGPDKGSLRVLRGGSWAQPPAPCRSSNRGNGGPGPRHGDYGLRLVMVVPAPGPR